MVSEDECQRALHEARRQVKLRQPWKTINMHVLPEQTRNHCLTVLIMGRYKAGKSSILQWMGVRDALPDKLSNAKGEVYLTDEAFPNTLFVDTEGFDQPINSDEPDFRKHFKQLFIQHAVGCADVILLVVTQLLQSDFNLLMNSLHLSRVSRLTVWVLHNLPTFTERRHLMEYRDGMRRLFEQHPSFEAAPTKWGSPDVVLLTTMLRWPHQTSVQAVRHMFLGADGYMSEYNHGALRQLAESINNMGRSYVPLEVESARR